MTHKVTQLALAATGFFWCFLMWFATAAFSPSIAHDYNLTLVDMGILASSALWLAPIGRIVAGWASDKLGARNTFTVILLYTGIFSIISSFATDYNVLFITRVIVSTAGVSFVVGIQHVAQWFEEHEIGTAEGLYAGTGNVGAGMGALLLPRIYETNYSAAFLHLGIIAIILAFVYFSVGVSAKNKETEEKAKKTATLADTLFVWTRWPAIALMFAYAMSFGLEIAMNAWLPGYYSKSFTLQMTELGYTSLTDLQNAAGTFAAVQSFNASLFRPFSGYMSDVFQRRKWTPFPLITKNLPYSPRIHWLMTALLCITFMMVLLSIAGIMGILPASVVILAILGITISFGTGSTFAIVPLMFKNRPGTATGFIGGVSTAFAIVFPLIFAWDLLPSPHWGYVFLALILFVPFILIFIIAFKYDEHPEEHGIGSKEYWVGAD
jgi:NNP family nitrate/nitrite transporter-like MFS transporter